MRLIDANLFDKELEDYGNAFYDAEFYMIENVRSMLEDAPTVNPSGWISVKDRLPEDTDEVIVCTRWSTLEICWLDNTLKDCWYHDSGMFEIDEVTHWMPLPELPKGE